MPEGYLRRRKEKKGKEEEGIVLKIRPVCLPGGVGVPESYLRRRKEKKGKEKKGILCNYTIYRSPTELLVGWVVVPERSPRRRRRKKRGENELFDFMSTISEIIIQYYP